MRIVGFILTRNNKNLVMKAISKIPSCINDFFISDDNSNDGIEALCRAENISIYKNYRQNNGYGSNVKNALEMLQECTTEIKNFGSYNGDAKRFY